MLNKWDEKYNFSLNIKYEVEYVRNDGSIDVHKVGANIVMIDDDEESIKVAEKVLKENLLIVRLIHWHFVRLLCRFSADLCCRVPV